MATTLQYLLPYQGNKSTHGDPQAVSTRVFTLLRAPFRNGDLILYLVSSSLIIDVLIRNQYVFKPLDKSPAR